MTKLLAQLNALDACCSARAFYVTEGTQTVSEAWMKSTRGEWMLYLIAAIIPDDQRPRLIAAACRIARRACELHFDVGSIPAVALDTTEAWVAHPSRHNRDIARKAYEEADRFHDCMKNKGRDTDAAYACVCVGQLVAEPTGVSEACAADDLVTASARVIAGNAVVPTGSVIAKIADEIRDQFSPAEIEGWMPG